MPQAPLVVLAALLLGPALAQGSCRADAAGRAARFEAVLARLSGAYTVERGAMTYRQICTRATPNCLGENPSSPYGRYRLPSELLFNDSAPVWQLRGDAAVLLHACTPPPARYFGLQSYAMISSWRFLFASLGDSVNLRRFNTTRAPQVNVTARKKKKKEQAQEAGENREQPDRVFLAFSWLAPLFLPSALCSSGLLFSS